MATDPKTEKLERCRLPTQSSESAYVGDTVVHMKRKSVFQEEKEVGEEWKRQKKVGEGGFGRVWAEREQHGALRAVKGLFRPTLHRKFMREIEIMESLREHSHHFVRFFGWFEDSCFVFIAMEYFELGDLGQYIKDYRENAKSEAFAIARQLLQGLAILHEKKVCHRDLKPQNVLIAAFSPLWVKIADFGVSKCEIDTRLRTDCGTQCYKAPEQLRLLDQRTNKYTNAVDLWALGSLLHEILTSKIPFAYNEVGPSTAYSGLESEVVTRTNDTTHVVDTKLLYEYCQGMSEFPTAILEEAHVARDGIDFVKALMVADPRHRISASGALKSMLLPEHQFNFEELRSQFSSLGIQIGLQAVSGCRANITDLLPPLTRSYTGIIKEAAYKGYTEAVMALLRFIDEIDLRIGGFTLLECAAGAGHLSVAKVLIESGADVNAVFGPWDLTALYEAAEGGHLDMAKLLLNSGAGVNALSDSYGSTALCAAAGGDHLDMAKLLLNSGADVNGVFGPWDSTALGAAAQGGHLDMAKLLLNSGASVNVASNTWNSTALGAAVEGGHLDMVKLLLNNGAGVNTYVRRKTFKMAKRRRFNEIAKLLREDSAVLDIDRHGGRSKR